MVRIVVALFCCLLAAAPALAQETPVFTGPESKLEQAFVKRIQADLGKRFAHAKDAERAGYARYTNEDDTGAISYANPKWFTGDPRHPSQLWYDVNGKLLGADFSVPFVQDKRPVLWGINPGRWIVFPEHVHFVSRDAVTHNVRYGRGMYMADFLKAGGDAANPQAATLVKAGKVKSVDEVVTIFHFPNIYDLQVWITPNPSGAFAAANPLVKPTKKTP